MMKVVTATAKDLTLIRDLDVRTYFYPLTNDGWAYVFNDNACVVYLCTIGKRSIGFMILEPSGNNMRLHRLGILRQFRGLGAAKLLMRKAEEFRAATKSAALEVTVPEIHCAPGDPDDVSVFLKWQGFKATGVKTDFYSMYGRKYDGFVFERGPQW